MEFIAQPVTLGSGASITVRAWAYAEFSANLLDYRALLQAFRERTGGEAGSANQQLLLDRVILASVPSSEDRALVMAPDLPELLEAIFLLNRVEDVASKSLWLCTRLLQAEMSSLEAEEARPLQSSARLMPSPT